MMGNTESYDFVYKKTYGLESHPELTLTSRLSDQAIHLLIQKRGILFVFRLT